VNGYRTGSRLRVRLLLAEDGGLAVTVAEQPAQVPGALMRFVLSETRLDSTNAFLFHKTTRRELYDREWQHYADTLKADEVLYLNERGELAEGIAFGGFDIDHFSPGFGQEGGAELVAQTPEAGA